MDNSVVLRNFSRMHHGVSVGELKQCGSVKSGGFMYGPVINLVGPYMHQLLLEHDRNLSLVNPNSVERQANELTF